MISQEEFQVILENEGYQKDAIPKITKNLKQRGNPEKTKKVVSLLKKEDIDVRDCLSILTRSNSDEIENIIQLLKKENIDVRNCLSILVKAKSSEIEKIIVLLKKENIEVQKCLSILAFGHANEIEKIINLLKKENIEIQKCLSILAKGKACEIEKIIQLLKEENIDVRDCLSILAQGKADEIEKMIHLLKRENIDIRSCLSVLACGKTDEIEKIINLLKVENIDVQKCLSILAFGHANEMEKMINLLKQENIDVQNCLSILTSTHIYEFTNKINIFKKFDALEGLKNNFYLASYVFKTLKVEEIVNIFLQEKSKNKERNLNQRELKFLFVIREKHNHYYFLDDIKNYCENMNINIEEFLFLFKGNHEILIHYYLERLKNGKSIWIGKKYPISKENLYKYGSFILDVCQTVSLMFIKKNPKYSYLYDELKGYVMDQLLTTAGNFFDEMENEAILKHILSTYYIKVLSRFVINYENFSFYDSKTMKSKNNFFDDMNKNVDEMSFYENDLFIDHEYEILNTINMLVQNGYENYEDFVKQKYHLNDEEYSSVLSEIQRKILKKDNYFN